METVESSATNAHFSAPMQEVTDRLESRLYAAPEPKQTELDNVYEEEVLGDDLDLPSDDDSESENDESSDDELDTDNVEEELSLAALLGVDEDRITVSDDGSVLVKTIIDGEEQHVDLKDLTASYQLQGHVNNKSIAAENERKQFEAERNRVAAELQIRAEGLSSLGKMLEEQVIGDYNSLDWERLREEDPAEWVAMRQQFAERARQVKDAQVLLQEEQQRVMLEQQQEQSTMMQAFMREQNEKVLSVIPAWTDERTRTTEQKQMREFMEETYGYSQDELAHVSDHRLVLLIRDALAFRTGRKGAETKMQKQVPKFRKPGVAKANAAKMASARKVKANKAAIRNSGGHPSAIAASLLDRM